MKQCTFSRGDNRTVGFIPDDPRVKPGVEVELIDPETKDRAWWNVDTVGQSVRREAINRGWHNNI
jgi:hypothetical protein